ncbi:ABC-type transport auxiliary lipoprotein family protein [Variovorax ginsengisoli]|uniref:Cholesterol transport system auxiliary component n=1 Tax=Variovorax ginsengisoli TaxID=363844 RepID=A0ABT9S4X7_9BURK|nr:ABC-type transport auxiliary lipoprotein family protein [Variovorax ginsengisoli]MDP9899412.1 cholesterol transport system auxiliary component [Variovorax ginsengisoli]
MNVNPKITLSARRLRVVATLALGAAASALLLAGCGALPDRPARAVLYDFGPGLVAGGAAAVATAGAPVAAGSTLALADIEASARLEGTQVLYRLGYADGNELRPYGLARWSVAPVQLVHQRLNDALSVRHTVLSPRESASMARSGGRVPNTLRVTLEEFSQYFEAPSASVGLVRLRATLIQTQPGGDRVLAQRSFTVQRPAPTADAAGGVKALAAATEAAVTELAGWVDATR